MAFKIISSRHVTARQRQILQWMDDNRATSAATKTIHAKAEMQADGTHKVTFRKNERDDWNRPIVAVTHAVVQFSF
jgi:hypothetical protein